MNHFNLFRAPKGRACGLCCTKIKQISVQRGAEQILEKIDLHLHCGELTALIGPNGAGKSTLLKALIGEMTHQGELEFLDAAGERANSPVIGYVPQALEFDKSLPLSVEDLFAAALSSRPLFWGIGEKKRAEIKSALELAEASHLYRRKLGELSGGELQRVLLALALTPRPDLLLPDEPVSGVDHRGLTLFYTTVSRLRENYDLSIILVSHDLPLVYKFADRVVLLNRRVVCQGAPAEVFNAPEFSEIFGPLRVAKEEI